MEPDLIEISHTDTHGRLMSVWAAMALLFGSLLVASQFARSPLDDPDPARQRPGLLDLGGLPEPAPSVTAEMPHVGRRAVVFFVRPTGLDVLCRALRGSSLSQHADLLLVVSGTGVCAGTATVNDDRTRIAGAYGLRHPRSGGAPVGYAVVDRRGQIRYRTLDPRMAKDLREVETMVRATP